MPTYSYECKDCGHTYDAFQSIMAEPDSICPQCNGSVVRLISGGAGIVFKGSGFYVTDYNNSGKSGQAAAASESTGSTSSESGSSGTGSGSGEKSSGSSSAKDTAGAKGDS